MSGAGAPSVSERFDNGELMRAPMRRAINDGFGNAAIAIASIPLTKLHGDSGSLRWQRWQHWNVLVACACAQARAHIVTFPIIHSMLERSADGIARASLPDACRALIQDSAVNGRVRRFAGCSSIGVTTGIMQISIQLIGDESLIGLARYGHFRDTLGGVANTFPRNARVYLYAR